jgi:hypothetical protein
MLIQDIKTKSRDLIRENETKLKYTQVDVDKYLGSVNSHDLRELLELIGKTAYNILGKENKGKDFDPKEAIKAFNGDIPNVFSLSYILNAYRNNDDANLGLENYLNSFTGSSNALKHFDIEFSTLNIIFKYNVKNEYLTSPLTEYTKDLFAYKWILCMAYLMIDLYAKNDVESIPYGSILSDLTNQGIHKRFLDDKDFDYTFHYDDIMYAMGGTGLATILKDSNKADTPMYKLSYLLYNGFKIGINLDNYFKIATKLLETKFYKNESEQIESEGKNTEEMDLTDEDRIALLKGHITEVLKKAEENGLTLSKEFFNDLLE